MHHGQSRAHTKNPEYAMQDDSRLGRPTFQMNVETDKENILVSLNCHCSFPSAIKQEENIVGLKVIKMGTGIHRSHIFMKLTCRIGLIFMVFKNDTV